MVAQAGIEPATQGFRNRDIAAINNTLIKVGIIIDSDVIKNFNDLLEENYLNEDLSFICEKIIDKKGDE